MFSKFSIGIYFSNSHAYMICLENTFSGVRVKKHELIDFVESDTLIQQVENIEQYINNFVETIQTNDTEIHIGFPRTLSIVRVLEFPLAVRDDLSSAITYSLEKYIPVKSEDLYFDYTVLAENKENNTITILLAAAKKSDMKPFVDLAVSLKSGASGVHVNSSAIVNYVSHETDLLKQNYEDLFFCHYDNRNLDIVSFKKNTFVYSQCVQPDDEDQLFERIHSLTDPKVSQKQLFPVNIVLFGQGIATDLRQRLENDPHISLKSHGFDKYNLPSEDFMPAFGLALNGFIRKKYIQMNLLPVSKRKNPSRTGKTLMVFLMILVVIFGIISGASMILNQRMIQKNLDAEISRLESDVREVADKKAQIEAIRTKIDGINDLRKDNLSLNDILNELSRIIPPGSWVNGLTYDIEKGMRISGQSDVASELISLIETSALFENCVFLSAITKDQTGKERFLIGFEISKAGTHE